MIISKTPFRISFGGGGTDLKSFYSLNGGKVINTSIDKYLYVLVRRQIGFVEYKYRINWSKIEFKNKINDIQHPIVRETLKYFKIDFPIEISTFADIPSNTGLGSSSAFAVGLVKALSQLLNMNYSNRRIAEIASFIEIEKLKRPIGKQDHYACSIGGLNKFIFSKHGHVKISKIKIEKRNVIKLEKSLMLLYTKIKRNSSSTLKIQNNLSPLKVYNLNMIMKLVNNLTIILRENNISINKFGKLLGINWIYKKKLSSKIEIPKVEKKYEKSLKMGVIGGKILGAGNGGFILLVLNKNRKLIKNFFGLHEVKFKLSSQGTRIIFKSTEI